MLGFFSDMFSHAFLIRAVLIGSIIAVCAALLGVTLVLKRYSMIGDGLSHVGFASLSIALAFNAAPLVIAIPAVVAAAFFLLKISENSRIKSDSLIAIVATLSLSAGVIVTSLSGGVNADVYGYMFGSILAMNDTDVIISLVLAFFVFVLYVLFYNKLFAITFDEGFAKSTGARVNLYNMLIALLTAVTIVVGMRMMGTLLISGLIIFPALTSMRMFTSFRGVVISSAIVSALCCFFGIAFSYGLNIPAGASIVAVNAAALLIFAVLGRVVMTFKRDK
ncbi:MAG: metal ABC transporter permease [Clostridia bacterium]